MEISRKETYSQTYERVKVLVNEFDPCGLIALGAPDDEYDCLTNEIIHLLNESTTVQKIKDIVIKEIQEHFGVRIPTKEPHWTNFYNALSDFAVKVRQLGYRGMLNDLK
jgi:hypothetical protein